MTRRSSVRALACSALLGGALVACGSDASTPGETGGAAKTQTSDKETVAKAGRQSDGAADPDRDLCAVVTAQDVAVVFGGPAREAEPSGPEPTVSGICVYESTEADPTVRQLLQMRVYEGAQYYGDVVFPEAEPLAGVGEKAFLNVNEAAHLVDIQFIERAMTGAINYAAGTAVAVGGNVDALTTIAEKLAASM